MRNQNFLNAVGQLGGDPRMPIEATATAFC